MTRPIQPVSQLVKEDHVRGRGLLHIVPHRLSLGCCYSCSAENSPPSMGLSNPFRH
jgi:hypothetical protein